MADSYQIPNANESWPSADDYAIGPERTPFHLTMERIKKCIAYNENSEIFKLLSSECDSVYQKEKEKGSSEQEALLAAFTNLGKRLMDMAIDSD